MALKSCISTGRGATERCHGNSETRYEEIRQKTEQVGEEQIITKDRPPGTHFLSFHLIICVNTRVNLSVRVMCLVTTFIHIKMS
jgi:hypothetical protein